MGDQVCMLHLDWENDKTRIAGGLSLLRCVCVCVCACVHTQSCLTLCDPMDCAPPASSVHGILQARHWIRLPFPPPGHLPDSRIEPASPGSPSVWAGRFFYH